MRLNELTSRDFARKRKNWAVLPIGCVEAHGPHLPIGSDTYQIEYVVSEIEKRTGALVLPTVPYGVCTSTRFLPGSVSLRPKTMRRVAQDILGETVRNGFKKILVISGHAAALHLAALREAALAVAEKHDATILVLSDYDLAFALPEVPPGDGHSGTIETSRVLAIRPRLVRGRGKKDRFPHSRFLVTRRLGVGWSGVAGDPRKASSALGRKVNQAILRDLIALMKEAEGVREAPRPPIRSPIEKKPR